MRHRGSVWYLVAIIAVVAALTALWERVYRSDRPTASRATACAAAEGCGARGHDGEHAPVVASEP